MKQILIEVLKGYTGKALNGYSWLTSNADETFFTVTTIGKTPKQQIVDSGLVVRLMHNKIIIDRDVNDKILLDALLAAGIPREQIILTYAGESAETTL